MTIPTFRATDGTLWKWNPFRSDFQRDRAAEAGEPALGVFGHHPDPEIDFGVEVEALIGQAYNVSVRFESQWPFWGALSRALRVGRASDWFGQPHLEATLLGLEGVALGAEAPAPPEAQPSPGTPP